MELRYREEPEQRAGEVARVVALKKDSRKTVFLVVRAAATSAGAFWFAHCFSYQLQLECLHFYINWGEHVPPFITTLASFVAAVTAGAVAGIVVAASIVAAPYVMAVVSVFLAAVIVYPLTIGLYGMRVDLGQSGVRGGVLVVLAMALAAGAVHIRRQHGLPRSQHLPQSGIMSENDGAQFRERAVKKHYGLIAALWILGGFVSSDWAAVALAAIGAILFALHTYPRLRALPRIRLSANIPIIVPAVLIGLVPLRDVPFLRARVFIGNYAYLAQQDEVRSQAGALSVTGFQRWHLISAWEAAVAAVGALALIAVLAAVSKPEWGVQLRKALKRGGWAILLLVWPSFYLSTAQWLPLALLLLLYAYYLSANTSSLRPLFKFAIIGASWVPIVGLWQFGQHYLALWRSGGSLPPLSSYRLGLADPFMWPTCVGMTIAVLLPLVYGLHRTAERSEEKRYLVWIGALLFVAMILTFCRSAWLSTIAVVTIGSVWIGGRRYWWVPALILVVAAGGALAHLAGVVGLDQFLGRESSTNTRVDQIRLTWNVLRQHPLFGIAPTEWDRRWLALGNTSTWGIGGLVAGWFQVPAESGLAGTALLLIMAAAFGVKVRRVIRGTTDAHSRLLLQCATLGIVSVIVSNMTECTLLQEGHYLLPILLGAILGWGRAQPWTQGQAQEGILGPATG